MRNLYWEDIEKATKELADKIRISGFRPEYIIGITAGGLVPLGLLVKQLKIEKILTISAKSYDNKKRKELDVIYLPQIDLSNKKVLLIDEIADTGTTLKEISDIIIKKYKAKELKTATIVVNKSRCKFWPDFSAIIEEKEWIVFPWEKEEK